jgi:hypothetical protein
MGFPAKTSQIAAQAIVVAFYGEGVRLALKVPVLLKDDPIGMPEIGAKGDVPAVRKLRIQTPGRFGSTIAQRPSADFLGSTINSPPQPDILFFLPTYVHSSSASTHSTSEAPTGASTFPSTSWSTQFMIELWLTPTSRSVARWPTPSR